MCQQLKVVIYKSQMSLLIIILNIWILLGEISQEDKLVLLCLYFKIMKNMKEFQNA